MKWAALWATFALLGTPACKDACAAAADAVRQCCARGPTSLRAECEAEARRLEQNGNSDACDAAIRRGDYAGCQE